jgi:hypothetical protein
MPRIQQKRFSVLFLAILVLCPALFAGGKKDKEVIYHVSPEGKDTDKGLSPKRPFKTLRRALEAVISSDSRTILVMGELTDSSEVDTQDTESVFYIGDTAGKTITIRGSGDQARLSAVRTNKRVLRITGGAQVRLENIEITGGRGTIGGGVLGERNASLTIAQGTRIRENQADAGGGACLCRLRHLDHRKWADL